MQSTRNRYESLVGVYEMDNIFRDRPMARRCNNSISWNGQYVLNQYNSRQNLQVNRQGFTRLGYKSFVLVNSMGMWMLLGSVLVIWWIIDYTT